MQREKWLKTCERRRGKGGITRRWSVKNEKLEVLSPGSSAR